MQKITDPNYVNQFIMKNKRKSNKKTIKVVRKTIGLDERVNKPSHYTSRKFLTKLFLAKVEEQKISFATLTRETTISKSTFQNMKNGKCPVLPTLCLLFSTPLTSSMLNPEDAGWVVQQIISESLRSSTRYPQLRIVEVPEIEDRKSVHVLAEYMKNLRTKHLKTSIRETALQFDYCSRLQITNIESTGHGVGIGPTCNLFNNYLCKLSYIPDEEWGTFSTLILHKLFPFITGYALKFTGWKK